MKKAIICGAGGFIGFHLARRLKAEGYHVRGMDRKFPEFGESACDEFLTRDLRKYSPDLFEGFDEVYQLACEVGGLGYIMDKNNDAEMLHNSMQINLSVLEACRRFDPRPSPKIFFASSACVYPSLSKHAWPEADACLESDAYPAHPDNEYAWEKLFAERLYDAYARNYRMQVRIGRFHNCYGAYGTWRGGREKAPAAIMRKVAEARDHGFVEIWGSGKATRSFMHVLDAVEGILRLMRSDFQGPVNIGSSEMVSVNDLTAKVIAISGKTLVPVHVDGPVGVQGRNSDQTLIQQKLRWQPSISLEEGLRKTYPWIAEQVENARE